jgi:hypothetical protein
MRGMALKSEPIAREAREEFGIWDKRWQVRCGRMRVVDGRISNRASRQYDATEREVTHVYIAQLAS